MDEKKWRYLLFVLFYGFITLFIQLATGSEVVYFLRSSEKYQDDALLPSIFYLLGWISHNDTC